MDKGEGPSPGGEKSGVGADSRLSSGGLGEREGGGEGAMGASVGALGDVDQLRLSYLGGSRLLTDRARVEDLQTTSP